MNEIETLPQQPPLDWRQRASQFHEQQWALAQKLLALAQRSLLHHLGQPNATPSLAQVERLLRLAGQLGQISNQLAPDVECPKCRGTREAIEMALDKVYGKRLPGEVPEPQPAAPEASQPATPTLPLPQPLTLSPQLLKANERLRNG